MQTGLITGGAKAEEARKLAIAMKDPFSRRGMLQLAEGYDARAELAAGGKLDGA
jgi:hypothetical protein